MPKLDDFMPRILVVALGLAAALAACGFVSFQFMTLQVLGPRAGVAPSDWTASEVITAAILLPISLVISVIQPYMTTYLVWQMGVAGVVVAEVRGESSFFFHMGCWLAAGLASAGFLSLLDIGNLSPVFPLDIIAPAAAGGFAYWLLAGRGAGGRKRTEDGVPPPPTKPAG